MEGRVRWLLLLLVAVSLIGAATPFRDKGGTGFFNLAPFIETDQDGGSDASPEVTRDNHIKLRETGAELHAHILAESFEAGSPQDMAAISLKGINPSVHKGFQFTSKDIANVRYYLLKDGSRKQRSCELNGFFWECELSEKALATLTDDDQIILRATVKADSVTESREIRKDIMGLPNSEFKAIESIFIKATPRQVRDEPIPIDLGPLPMPPELPPMAPPPRSFEVVGDVEAATTSQQLQEVQPEQQVQQQPQHAQQQQQQQRVRRSVPDHVLAERVRRQEVAEQKRQAELTVRRAAATMGVRQAAVQKNPGATRTTVPTRSQQRAQQQQQPQQKVAREVVVPAEQLANGNASIKRGGIASSNSAATSAASPQEGAREKRGVSVTSGGAGYGATPELKTLINLNFEGMIPENQCDNNK